MMEKPTSKQPYNYKNIKLLAFCALTVIFAGWFSYELISVGFSLDYKKFGLAVALLLLWLSLASLVPFFVRNKKFAFLVYLFQTAAVWFFAPDKFSIFSLGAGTALFVFLLFAYLKGRQELNDYSRIRFFRISRRASRLSLTGIVLFIVVLFIGTLNFPAFDISRTSFNFFFEGSGPVIRTFLPGFTSDSSVQETLEEFVKRNFPDSMSDAAIIIAVEELRNELSRLSGIIIELEMPAVEAVYQFAIGQLSELSLPMKTLALIVMAILSFSILEGIAFFLNLFVTALAFLFYHLLHAFNFFKLSYENINKEVIIVN